MLKISTLTFKCLLLLANLYYIYGDTELCNANNGTRVFTFRKKFCPGGILFTEPVEFTCLQSSPSTDTTEWKEDVCADVAYSTGKVQLMVNLDDETLPEDESCSGEAEGKCNMPKLVVSELMIKPRVLESEEEFQPSPEESALSNDTAVVDQTERMLKYLYGLLEDPDEDGPVLRIVELLKTSFDITMGYCTEPWLTGDFTREILKAYLFILRESDINRIRDITIEEFDRINLALTACKDSSQTDQAFTIDGSTCLTGPKIGTIKPGEQPLLKFKRNSKSFRLNKFDLVVDAAWSMLDFVHGICFNKFSPHFNSHHLYQQAIERIFTDEIIYRWTRPTILTTSDAWDAVFLGNVRTNMRNIDACIQGAYQGKPYLHRLERILETQSRRIKRSLTDKNSLDGAGWCLQNESERKSVVQTLCPQPTTLPPDDTAALDN